MRREYIIDDEMLARFDGWFEFPREDERLECGGARCEELAKHITGYGTTIF